MPTDKEQARRDLRRMQDEVPGDRDAALEGKAQLRDPDVSEAEGDLTEVRDQTPADKDTSYEGRAQL